MSHSLQIISIGYLEANDLINPSFMWSSSSPFPFHIFPFHCNLFLYLNLSLHDDILIVMFRTEESHEPDDGYGYKDSEEVTDDSAINTVIVFCVSEASP